MYIYTLSFGKNQLPIVRNRVTKLEFSQTKIWLFWKRLDRL